MSKIKEIAIDQMNDHLIIAEKTEELQSLVNKYNMCYRPILANPSSDFVKVLDSLMTGKLPEYAKKVSISTFETHKDLQKTVEMQKELIHVYAIECCRLQTIIHNIPPEILEQYRIKHSP